MHYRDTDLKLSITMINSSEISYLQWWITAIGSVQSLERIFYIALLGLPPCMTQFGQRVFIEGMRCAAIRPSEACMYVHAQKFRDGLGSIEEDVLHMVLLIYDIAHGHVSTLIS